MNFKNFFEDSLSFPQDKKQKILIAVLIFVLFITAVVFYFGFSDKDLRGTLTATSTDDTIYLIDKAIDDIDFDIGFLNYLDDLKIYGRRPSGEIQKGTTNPFLEN